LHNYLLLIFSAVPGARAASCSAFALFGKGAQVTINEATKRETMNRPDSTEHAPYFGKYIALVPGDNIVETLAEQSANTQALLRGLSEEQGARRYAPEKWSIKEVIGHLIDAERIFAYRALRIARNDQTPLPGFDENSFVAHADFAARTLRDLAEEFACVRQASLHLFQHLDETAWLRRGVSNNNEISVRALAYLTAGHELHHLNIIKERYL
jgi:uncharacterized damage-inducible protein DinB